MKNKWKQLLEKAEELLELGGTVKQVAFLLASGVALAFSVFGLVPVGFDWAWVAVALCGLPIVTEAFIGLVARFDIRAGLLVSISLVASLAIGQVFAAGEVAFIMQLGELLEHLTVKKARSGIEHLVSLTPLSTRVIKNGKEHSLPVEQVAVGDIIRVLPGETVPVDGVVVEGNTSINQSVITGESMPVDKTVGDSVLSGTVNQMGAFEMRAAKVGRDSSFQRIVELARAADPDKAKIVGVADRWATLVVVAALAAAVGVYALSGSLVRAVTVLVVFCPCALVLATPTAVMAAIGNVAKRGFLVKSGDALERLSAVRTVAFDKTGTLTYGLPSVSLVCSLKEGLGEDGLLGLAASAERLSEHPLGKSVVKEAEKRGLSLSAAEGFVMNVGQGISATVDGKAVLAGNSRLMAAKSVEISRTAAEKAETLGTQGGTLLYVAVDGVLCGFILLADAVRAEAADTVKGLQRLGVGSVLLTGDNRATAAAVAERAGVSVVKSECLPEDKQRYVKALQAKGGVCMVGDGVNDALALKAASVGIAMGGVGSDIAVDAADIVLTDDNVKALPHLFALSRRMLVTVKLNIGFSMGLNFLAVGLAATGALSPVLGALVHNAGSVAVIVNSALLLRWKRKK